jgi:hypothetical protein
MPAWVTSALSEAYRAKGIQELYSLQAVTVELVRDGKNVVVVTPTASGKTLCALLSYLFFYFRCPLSPLSSHVNESRRPRALEVLQFRVRAILPEQYQNCYDDVKTHVLGIRRENSQTIN